MTTLARKSELRRIPGGELCFRCDVLARWLPRLLAATVLVATLLASFRLESARTPAVFRARYFVVLVGAVCALWIVRQGGELRVRLRLVGDALIFEDGRRRSRLPFDQIDSLSYAPPFSVVRSWLPATLLFDRQGRSWRVSALLRSGDHLIAELVRRTGRHDLQVWSETLRLEGRMGRASIAIGTGYLVGVTILAAALVFYLR
jgi:hypothetical protein